MIPSDDSATIPSDSAADGIPAVGLIAALPEELGSFRTGGRAKGRRLGVSVREHGLETFDGRLLTALSGVGKVAAAHAAAALIEAGAGTLLVVGTCGGLRPGDAEGTLVFATRCIQWDLGVRAGRESIPDAGLTRCWREVVPSARPGVFLTADRAAIRWIDRARRARAFRFGERIAPHLHVDENETIVADMETAAIGAVAERAGVPFAALRVVSDTAAGPWRALSGRIVGRKSVRETLVQNLGRFGGRPAESVAELLIRLPSHGCAVRSANETDRTP